MKKLTAILTSAFMLTASVPFVPVNYAVAADTTATDTEVTTETYTITLSDSGITTTAGADIATVSNNVITITQPAIFEVSGEMSEGQIVVNVDKTAYPDGVVELDLLGVNLTNTSDSPIYVASIGDECQIVAKKGYENTISDGTSYTNADGKMGAIYSCDDLKIKGSGTLTVNGNCEDGIVSKNDLKIYNGTVIVNAVDDAIRGKDSVTIGNADDTSFDKLNVTVKSTSGDGIKSTETDTTTGKGYITVNGGTVDITAYSDGFHASQLLNINGGDINIETTCPANSSSGGNMGGGGFPGGGGSTSTSTDTSAKGLKAGCTDDTTSTTIEGTINIAGGNITINSTDDSVHATDINISGGNIQASSGDDGIHADDVLTITDGIINITKSYEGLEAYDIEIKGGNIHVVSSDDGFNAAGGNDSSGNSNTGGWGQGGWGGSSSTGILNISGGYMYVRAEGDGLDSNGNLTISGGTVIVCGPTRGGNGIFDKGDGNYTLTFSGGTVFGIGTSDMMETPTTSNGKYTSSTNMSLQAGTLIFAKDGNNVVSVLTVPSDMNMTGAVQFYSDRASSNIQISSGGTYDGYLNSDGYGDGSTEEPIVTTVTSTTSTTTQTTTTTVTSATVTSGENTKPTRPSQTTATTSATNTPATSTTTATSTN
ncbi:MAG: carbohydrate-binding domain-containing protein, partial [Ruminococcus sp.]